MSVQLSSAVPSSSGFGLGFGQVSTAVFGSGPRLGGGSGARTGLHAAGGYYSFIGGGAAPFGPNLNMRSLENGALLQSCARHMDRVNRRRRSLPAGYERKKYVGTGQSQDPSSLQLDASSRIGKLYCRSGYHLQIHDDGRVNGTRRDNNRFGILEFLSIAFGLVSIKGKETGRYLCMNRRGRLYGSTRHTGECIFMEKMLENYYNTYTSCRYGRGRQSKKKWYVALNKRGRPKRGNQSRKKHRFTQFLVLHLDDEEYKWTKRKFVFTSNGGDRYFSLDSFSRWDRVKPASSIRPSSTVDGVGGPSVRTFPLLQSPPGFATGVNATRHRHRPK